MNFFRRIDLCRNDPLSKPMNKLKECWGQVGKRRWELVAIFFTGLKMTGLSPLVSGSTLLRSHRVFLVIIFFFELELLIDPIFIDLLN
jgi:hypothetical protein